MKYHKDIMRTEKQTVFQGLRIMKLETNHILEFMNLQTKLDFNN